MSSHFSSRFVFHFLIKTQLEKNITWHYSERGCGKGPMDGIGGTVKNLVFKKVKSGHCIIDTPLQFAQHANETCESITSLHMSVEHLLEVPEDVKNAMSVPDTLQVYKAIRSMDISCFAIDFFRLGLEKPEVIK